jgi:hypothetical protein
MIYGDWATLITRLRRFGKSTNLSMFYTFLKPAISKEEMEIRLNLFKNLKIFQFDWFINSNFGNWPVIHVSFKISRTDATFPFYRTTNKDLFY